jgi:hypothetical protein
LLSIAPFQIAQTGLCLFTLFSSFRCMQERQYHTFSHLLTTTHARYFFWALKK